MADENKNQDENKAAPLQPGANSQNNQENQGGEQWFVPGKFKTSDDMKKSYEGIESTMGKVGDLEGKVAETQKFVTSASNLLNALYSDPDIQNVIKQKYGTEGNQAPNQNQGQDQGQNQPTGQPNQTENKLAEMDVSLRQKAITDFDNTYGINQEEAEDIHAKMKGELDSLGQDLRTVSLDKVPALLEKSFRLAHEERYNQRKKSEGAAQNMTNLQTQVPTQGGGSTPEGNKGEPLTNEQKDWLGKMGYDENKSQEVLKKAGQQT